MSEKLSSAASMDIASIKCAAFLGRKPVHKDLMPLHRLQHFVLREVVKTTTLKQDPPNHKIDGGVVCTPLA